MSLTRTDLMALIRQGEERLTQLDRERREVEERLLHLWFQIAHLSEDASEPPTDIPPSWAFPDSPQTPDEKVALFRSLFQGRSDVYPKFWTNPKKGTKGYSPACSNEWAQGLCEKPRIRCGECGHRSHLPVTDRVIQDHLQGKHTVGVYPMLEDETTWFLAADFDKKAWVDDVRAFLATCRGIDLPYGVERSRSGNGAHVWFFFSSPVPAVTARRMGCFLLTETMSCRHQLPMNSYDRLFPNQDTLPKGGLGNLIALPLQHGPRKVGNTVFLDDDLQPLADQWGFLSTVDRILPATVEEIAGQALRQGKVVGLRFPEPDDDDHADAPWERPPSRAIHRPKIADPLPEAVRSVLSQRLFIEKEALPSAVLNQIKRLAAFPNPEFYKKQRMRLSTSQTPRIISCAEELPNHVELPRGCCDDARELLAKYGVRLDIEDQRTVGQSIDVVFQGELTELQANAARAILTHDAGVFVAPPGVGKTVVGIHLIAARARNTLILVHRRPLMEQWIAQLSLFLGIPAKQIGRIGASRHKVTGTIDVAMIQSLVRGERVEDLVAGYGHVLIDECHHVPAVSFERVLAELKARYVTGLTATPQRRDGHHPILHLQIGPVRHAVHARHQAAQRPFHHVLMVRETTFRLPTADTTPPIQDVYRALSLDDERNRLILEDIRAALQEGRNPIVLTERRDHLDLLATELEAVCPNVIVMQGGAGAKERKAVVRRLAEFADDEPRVVVATGRYAGEGFDDARLDTLFLVMPVAWKGAVVQYTGRLHRLYPGKDEVRIYDYVDAAVPVLARMFKKRLAAYRAIGYVRHGEDGQGRLLLNAAVGDDPASSSHPST